MFNTITSNDQLSPWIDPTFIRLQKFTGYIEQIMVNAYSYDSNPASSRILCRIFPFTRKFSQSSAASDSLAHGGAFLSSRRRTEFISPVKSHSCGKPRKCTVAGCKDAIVHGRADQSMYRVNDFKDNIRSDVSSRYYVYLRSCGRCYGNRIVSLSYLYAHVRVDACTSRVILPSWVYIEGRRGGGGGGEGARKKARIKHDERREATGWNWKLLSHRNWKPRPYSQYARFRRFTM